MKRILSLLLAAALSLFLLCPAFGASEEEERIVLTIGDSVTRSGNRFNAEMGM